MVRPIFQRREETQGSKWLCPREQGCAAVKGCGVPSANLFTVSGGLEPLSSVYLGFQSRVKDFLRLNVGLISCVSVREGSWLGVLSQVLCPNVGRGVSEFRVGEQRLWPQQGDSSPGRFPSKDFGPTLG